MVRAARCYGNRVVSEWVLSAALARMVTAGLAIEENDGRLGATIERVLQRYAPVASAHSCLLLGLCHATSAVH